MAVKLWLPFANGAVVNVQAEHVRRPVQRVAPVQPGVRTLGVGVARDVGGLVENPP